MKRRPFLPCVAALLLAGLVHGSAEASTHTWKVWVTHPKEHPVSLGLQHLADVLKKQNAPIELDIYYNASLLPQSEAIQQVKSGDIPLAEFGLGALAETVPEVRLLTMPFLFRNSTHLFNVLNGPIGKRYEAKLYEAGYVVLGWYDGGSRSFYCNDSKINTIAQLKGKRIRALGMQSEMVTILGATPVKAAYQNVLIGLVLGAFDCAENNIVSYHLTDHYKIANHLLLTNHNVSPEPLVVSRKVWEALPAQQQRMLRTAGYESAQYMRQVWVTQVTESMQAIQQAGVKITVPADLASMVKKMEPLYKSHLRDASTKQDLMEILKTPP